MTIPSDAIAPSHCIAVNGRLVIKIIDWSQPYIYKILAHIVDQVLYRNKF